MKSLKFFANLMAGIIGGVLVIIVYNSYVNKNQDGSQIDKVSYSNSTNPVRLVDTNSNGIQAQPIGAMSYSGALENEMVVAAKKTVDAVVHVKTAYLQQYSYGNPFLDYFFGDGYHKRSQPVMSSGSGVIISNDGYIITNNHVIERAEKIKVALNDKREFDAELVGTDPGTDIALLKIDEKDLPYLTPGNSDNVNIGEWVLAVGNPFNLTSTVTAGIVSAKARNINLMRENYGIESFIQTDAAVNPGNSGGALVNRKGELIGINTAIASKTGTFTGYSFAVPVNIAMKVAEDLIEYGQVQRAVMGVIIHDLNEDFARENEIETLNGVYIDQINEGGAADKAGIKSGDVVIRIGSVDINNVAQLQEQLSKFRPGDELKITVLRDNKEVEKEVVLQNRKGNTEILQSTDLLTDLGAKFEPVTDKEKKLLRISNGVKIAEISSGKLRNAGIHEGFIILAMNGMKIDDENDVRRVIEQADGGIMVEGIYPNGMKAYYAFGN
ncbi:MAG: deoxyribonuclease HsdR [Salinivirgaceae bacterium]|nr:MAG: deoxyribonuclease HsdR [Salinivirgaceae bacterium]